MIRIGREDHYTTGIRADTMTGTGDTMGMDMEATEDRLMMTDTTGLERTMTLLVDTDLVLEEDHMIGKFFKD